MIPSRKDLLGYALVLLSILCFVASGAAVQALERAVPDFELSVFRYSGATIISLMFIIFKRKSFHVSREYHLGIIMMGVTGFTFNLFYYFATSLLPLAHVYGLNESFRTISFSILICYITKTCQNFITTAAILGCIVGAVLVVQPWSAFSSGFIPGFMEISGILSNSSYDNSLMYYQDHLHNTPWVIIGYICLLLAGITEAFYLLAVGVKLQNVDSFIQVFYSSLLCVPISVIASFYMEKPTTTLKPLDIIFVLAHVTSITFTILTEVFACKLIDPLQVSIMENLTTIVSLVPQYTFLSTHLYGRRNALEVAGCVVITGSLSLSGVSSTAKKHEDL